MTETYHLFISIISLCVCVCVTIVGGLLTMCSFCALCLAPCIPTMCLGLATLQSKLKATRAPLQNQAQLPLLNARGKAGGRQL